MKRKLAKILCLALSLVMIIGILAACADEPEPVTPTPEPTTEAPATTQPAEDPGTVGHGLVEECTCEEPVGVLASQDGIARPAAFNTKTPANTFVVGTPPMNGDFVTGWGNSSYDLSIKEITGGYKDTYQITPEGQIVLNNSVVHGFTTEFDDEGNKTYTFALHKYIKWNNGESITAHDYVAGVLAYASPALVAHSGSSTYGDGIVGYTDYLRGPVIGEEPVLDDDGNPVLDDDGNPAMQNIHGDPLPNFAGIKLIDDYTFSATIAADQLPYFWETSFVTFRPIYLAGWFPGNSIISDDSGARFANSIDADMERISTTERFAPTVTCGPYSFVSFDGSTVNLERNPYFGACNEGYIPYFDYIIQMEVPDETSFEMLLNGDIDFEQGVVVGAEIEAGKASEFVEMTSYLRAGFGHLTYAIDFGPTQDVNVRWAISHMIDRSIIIDHVLGGYGGTVDAAYGLAQWTYQARRRELTSQLAPISYNLEIANGYLDESDYRFEADGTTPFDSSKVTAGGTYLRHNANGEVLRIVACSGSLDIGNAIEAAAIAAAPLIGMVFEVEAIDFSTLLDHYYYGKSMPAEERNWHAFQLAVNFTPVDDKYWSYHSDLADSWQNAQGIRDAELDRITMAMRSLDASEVDAHADLWLEFQVRWQQLMPALPLYSNEYFDAFNNVVTQVPTSPYANWQDVLMHIAKHS